MDPLQSTQETRSYYIQAAWLQQLPKQFTRTEPAADPINYYSSLISECKLTSFMIVALAIVNAFAVATGESNLHVQDQYFAVVLLKAIAMGLRAASDPAW